MQENSIMKFKQEIHDCELVKLFNLIGSRWSLQILHLFFEKKKLNYSDINNYFKKIINSTLLSNRLKEFEEYNIIINNNNNNNKAYEITEFGNNIMSYIHKIKIDFLKYNNHFPELCEKENCLCKKIFK